ncbi:hypothetical protein EV702DRAFT_785181 [Suillus placidus]|uniref:Zn(2)-C6 fungal-type domain-containing protein n=1 Tax=Suillus placidus TaxID=48579 RepID=A0A9P6ZJR4_9AGAM|nr:hypothetical protein EV702DRAFT_785181 [Suillus placidus]
MSTRTYPAFYSLNQPELELLSMPVQAPVDQALNLYPIFDEIAWHESLMATLQLFDQFLSGEAQHHNNTASSPTGDFPSVTQQNMSLGESSTPARETVSPEESYAPTRKLTGSVRSKRARVVHACDECRNKKKKCSGEQPLCLSCQKVGRECTWTPIKTSKNRPCLKYGVVKSRRPLSHTDERNSVTRQLHIASPKPTYPIKLHHMQGAATLVSAARNLQAATQSSPLGVGFPAQIAPRRTQAVDFDWGDFGSSDFSQECIPLPPTRPPYVGNVLSRVHPLHTRQLCHEDIYRRALAGQ